MTTREEAVAAAGRAVAAGITLRDSLPPRAAAEAAWTPTGPPVDELERMIRAARGEQIEVSESTPTSVRSRRSRTSTPSTETRRAA